MKDKIIDFLEYSTGRTISYSMASTWYKCPYSYYLRYVKKIKKPKPLHFVRGDVVHQALAYIKREGVRDMKKLDNPIEKAWEKATDVPEGVKDGEDLNMEVELARTKNLIAGWLKQKRASPISPNHVEMNLLKDLYNPRDRRQFDGMKLRGIIDEQRTPNGITEIKTANREWNAGREKFEWQADVYCLLLGQDIEVVYDFLIDTNVPKYILSKPIKKTFKQDGYRAFKMLSEFVQATELEFFCPSRGFMCGSLCEYSEECLKWPQE